MQNIDKSPLEDDSTLIQTNSLGTNSTLVTESQSNVLDSSGSILSATRCLECEQKFVTQELERHLLTCPVAKRRCSIDGCRFEGSNDEFLEHAISIHAQNLLSTFTQDAPLQLTERSEFSCDNDPIGFKRNGAGRKAWLGEKGKYYCNGKLNGQCYPGGVGSCCDGYCGPADGCNCRACMELDLESRRLPRGYWVNREGMNCTKGNDGKIYCGRRLYYQQCQPNEGVQCRSCRILQPQIDERYSGLG